MQNSKVMLYAVTIIAVAILTCKGIALGASVDANNDTPTNPTYVNPTGTEIPIVAWGAFSNVKRQDLINEPAFAQLKEAGFNICYSHLTEDTVVPKLMSLCKKENIKMMIPAYHTIQKNLNYNTIRFARDSSMVAGWFLWDEPIKEQFNTVSMLKNEVRQMIHDHQFIYVNLTNNGASDSWGSSSTYDDYVTSFLGSVKPEMLSFDNYCIVKAPNSTALPKVNSNYFPNLQIIALNANKCKIPMWTIILATAHSNYPIPELSHLYFQAFTQLGYGSQCLMYFKYSDSNNGEVNDGYYYHDYPIDRDGNKTDLWYRIKEVNQEIHKLDYVFLGMNLKQVWHMDRRDSDVEINCNTDSIKFKTLLIDKSETKPIMCSWFSNNGFDYLMIVNKDINSKVSVKISRDNSKRLIYNKGIAMTTKPQFSFPDNSEAYEDHVTLEPGGACIYSWRQQQFTIIPLP